MGTQSGGGGYKQLVVRSGLTVLGNKRKRGKLVCFKEDSYILCSSGFDFEVANRR
jgi:hypothetical protein